MKEECGNTAQCSKYHEELEVCNDRVNGKQNTTETCTQELFDFLHCTDYCVRITDVCERERMNNTLQHNIVAYVFQVSKSLFSKLK